MATGGSIESVSINRRLFPVAADADSNRDLGGFTAEVQPNGNGSARKVLTRKPWMLDGLSLEIDDNRGDLEFLQEVQDGVYGEWVPIVVTYVTSISYSGIGTVEGDLQSSSQNATAPVQLKGPQKLERQ